MKRIAAIVVVVSVAVGAVTGLAASLQVSSANLGSGIAPVTSCDSTGVTASYTILLAAVTHVVVSGIDDGSATVGGGACDGSVVHVEALDASGKTIVGAVGSATHTGDANTAPDTRSVPLTVPPLAAAVRGVRITITR